jgi:hypothetical protein
MKLFEREEDECLLESDERNPTSCFQIRGDLLLFPESM